MKNTFPLQGNHRRAIACLAYACLVPTMAYAQTTGFNQTTAGPHDYNQNSNWVGGVINGIWDSSLTLSAAQTATFGSNTAGTGLDLRYAGAQNLTLRADGTGPYTLNLGGNINVDTASANRTITIGSTTANQGLNIDLGNAIRTFGVGGISNSSSTRTLTIQNNVTNGGLILNGGGVVNLNGNNTLSSLRIQNNALRLTGNSGADTSTTVSGALTIDGAAASLASNTDHFGGIATITLTPNASHNTSLSASSLVRVNSGAVFFRGNNLGGTLDANGVSNITFASAPTLIGGNGAAGTTNISILNWAVGATTAAGNANTFVTYDSVNGIRALDTATEFQNYADTYSGAVTGTANSNTRIATGTVTLTGNNTVNSLFIGETGTATLAGNGGTLTVSSGAVFLNGANSAITANLDFGAQEGVIGYIQGQNTTISGGIAGSGGLTVYQAQPSTSVNSTGTGVTFSSAATFTGDFTVNSRASISHSDFLASGARTGNVVVNGVLQLNGLGTSGGYTMNGLYGNGRLTKVFSGAGLFRIGDNNSDGNFTGTITDGGTTAVEKIGNGTQIFSGANAYNGATRILGGTLEVTTLADGALNSGIGKSSNVASNLVLSDGTLKYTGAATSTDRLFQVGQTTTGANGTINASGSGAVNFTNTGAITYGTAGSTGTAQTRTLTLTGTNAGANTLSAVIGNNGSATNGNSDVSLVKSGTGSWTLTGANTYKGSTQVNEGKLVIDGSTSTGIVWVASGATLAGSGTVGGVTTISGILAPGGGIDTFTVNNDVTWNGAATVGSATNWQFELGSGNTSDTLDITGIGSDFLKGSGSIFNFDFLASANSGTFTLVDWADTGTTNFGINDFSYSNLGGGNTGIFSISGSQLNFTVIPEPNAALLLGAFGVIAILRRRR